MYPQFQYLAGVHIFWQQIVAPSWPASIVLTSTPRFVRPACPLGNPSFLRSPFIIISVPIILINTIMTLLHLLPLSFLLF